jgi:hypothetical protein
MLSPTENNQAQQNPVLFYERQRFRQFWLWALLLGVSVFMVWKAYNLETEGRMIGPFNVELLIGAGFCIVIATLIFSCFLETTIRKEGIYVRFFPFHVKAKYFSWDTLSQAYVRKYNALLDYGGWGVRYGLFGKGSAYNVSGNKGIQLVFKDGSKLLIGTQKPTEAEEALAKAGPLIQ